MPPHSERLSRTDVKVSIKFVSQRVSVHLGDPFFKDMYIALGYSSKSGKLLSDIVLKALNSL